MPRNAVGYRGTKFSENEFTYLCAALRLDDPDDRRMLIQVLQICSAGHWDVGGPYSQYRIKRQGTIIALSGPWPGRRHDVVRWTPPFQAYANDLVLFDGGYQGITGPVRIPRRRPPRSPLHPIAHQYNRGLSRFRSRIERFFGTLKGRYALMRRTDMSEGTHALFAHALCLCLHKVDHFRNVSLGTRYAGESGVQRHPIGLPLPW
jgi:hypothetical protein